VEFVLFVCTDSEGREDGPDNIGEWVDEMDGRGVRKLGDALEPPAQSTTVKVRGGELLVTDGPFMETKEWIAGFDYIECENLAEAIEIAAKHPMARGGQIEIRPVMHFN
jgi:hypothetical protein